MSKKVNNQDDVVRHLRESQAQDCAWQYWDRVVTLAIGFGHTFDAMRNMPDVDANASNIVERANRVLRGMQEPDV